MVLRADTNDVGYGPSSSGGTSSQALAQQIAMTGLAASAASASPTASDDPPVYWSAGYTGARAPGMPANVPGEEIKTATDAFQQVYSWYGTPKYQELVDYLVGLGLVSKADSTNIQSIADAWKDAVSVSAALGPGKKVNPWDAAKLLTTQDATSGAGGAGGGPKTQTSTSTNLTDPETAKGLINQAMAQALGRAATPDELAEFIDTLHAQQYANPQTSTTTYNADGTSATTNSSGGVDPGQVAQDEAMKLPDYGAYQAGTLYFGALQQLAGENG